MAKTGTKKALRKFLKSTLSHLEQCEEINLSESYRLSEKKVKLYKREYPFQINLHPEGDSLHVYPEVYLDGSKVDNEESNSYLVFDPKTYYSGISGFYRIKDDEKLIIGGQNKEQRLFLNISPKIAARKLSISNDDGRLTFKSLVERPRSCIAPLFKDKKVNRLTNWRMKKLDVMRKLFMQPIKPLDKDAALDLIKDINDLQKKDSHRPKTKNGMPGGIVEISNKTIPFIIGDIHAKPDNLLLVLSHNGFLEGLMEGTASLIILGDAVHPEGKVPLDEMNSSMLTMDLIFQLKLNFPDNVFYLRGNHDSYSDEVGKGGVPQGLLWASALKKIRGKAYKEQMQLFYDGLPYLAFSPHFIACHAGPPKYAVSKREIVDIYDHPKLMKELTTNRINSSVRHGGYTASDVKKLRKILGVEAKAPLICGHTPLSDDDTVWENVGKIEGHHIVHASNEKCVGVITQLGDSLHPFIYPAEPIISIINSLKDE